MWPRPKQLKQFLRLFTRLQRSGTGSLWKLSHLYRGWLPPQVTHAVLPVVTVEFEISEVAATWLVRTLKGICCFSYIGLLAAIEFATILPKKVLIRWTACFTKHVSSSNVARCSSVFFSTLLQNNFCKWNGNLLKTLSKICGLSSSSPKPHAFITISQLVKSVAYLRKLSWSGFTGGPLQITICFFPKFSWRRSRACRRPAEAGFITEHDLVTSRALPTHISIKDCSWDAGFATWSRIVSWKLFVKAKYSSGFPSKVGTLRLGNENTNRNVLSIVT